MALNLLSPVANVHRRDFEVSDSGMVDPDDSTHLQAGEWVGLDSSGQLQEAGDDIAGTYPVGGEGPFYQVFSQRGDTAAQALGKMTVIMSHDYEAETDMYLTGGTYAVGTLLTLSNGSTGAGGTGDTTRNILSPWNAVADMVVGVVTLPASATNSGLLRFQKVSPYFQTT